MYSPDRDPTAGSGVRIAVIDSGVHPQHPHIIARQLRRGTAIRGDGTTIDDEEAVLDRLGHGTAVTAAIQEKAPGAVILPVRVFHDGLKTSARALGLAIEWSLAAGADIINLSLGTANPAHQGLFAALVDIARARKTLIVAACEANGARCWPGALEGVLGVGVDWDLPREQWRVDNHVFFASGYPRPIPGVPQRQNLYGISFATAQASGFAACALQQVRDRGCPMVDLRQLMLDPERENAA